jgi:hypothetical protein
VNPLGVLFCRFLGASQVPVTVITDTSSTI